MKKFKIGLKILDYCTVEKIMTTDEHKYPASMCSWCNGWMMSWDGEYVYEKGKKLHLCTESLYRKDRESCYNKWVRVNNE